MKQKTWADEMRNVMLAVVFAFLMSSPMSLATDAQPALQIKMSIEGINGDAGDW